MVAAGDRGAVRTGRAWVAGLVVVLLWASAFPAIRVAAPALGVAGLSLVRLATAAIALLLVAPFAHVRLPERRQLPLVLAAAFAGMTAYQLLLNWGELHVPAQAREVFDVSGAGDTVVAVLAAMLGAGQPVADAVRLANRAGGIVVGKLGTAAVTPQELFE